MKRAAGVAPVTSREAARRTPAARRRGPLCPVCCQPADPVLRELGWRRHPACDPDGAELYCLACRRGPAGCGCAEPRRWRPDEEPHTKPGITT